MAYVCNILVPSLRRGDIIVLDNLRSHKAPEVAAAIRSARAGVEFLPPYSPDGQWNMARSSRRRSFQPLTRGRASTVKILRGTL